VGLGKNAGKFRANRSHRGPGSGWPPLSERRFWEELSELLNAKTRRREEQPRRKVIGPSLFVANPEVGDPGYTVPSIFLPWIVEVRKMEVRKIFRSG
jgi:hypothetical protein